MIYVKILDRFDFKIKGVDIQEIYLIEAMCEILL